MSFNVYTYRYDRSEEGLTAPIIRRIKERGWYADKWWEADIVIIPGDRREAIRFALDLFEAGKKIWHLGAGDTCKGDQYHHDGTYRVLMSIIASDSKGKLLTLRPWDSDLEGVHPCDWNRTNLVGPPQIDDIGDIGERPTPEPYRLLCYNYPPWDEEHIDIGTGLPVYAMTPGSDDPIRKSSVTCGDAKHTLLDHMPRAKFLRWLRHADEVWGNSSCLTYEAPLWHSDDKIHFIGKRNKGRGTCRWDVAKLGSPSDNVIRLLEAEADGSK